MIPTEWKCRNTPNNRELQSTIVEIPRFYLLMIQTPNRKEDGTRCVYICVIGQYGYIPSVRSMYVICIIRQRRKKGNVLFNDTLNTFYLRLYDVIHMVKDHSDSERGNPLLPHGLLSPISSKGSFICIIPQSG